MARRRVHRQRSQFGGTNDRTAASYGEETFRAKFRALLLAFSYSGAIRYSARFSLVATLIYLPYSRKSYSAHHVAIRTLDDEGSVHTLTIMLTDR